MKIARIADTNLSQELKNFFESFEYRVWKEGANFLTSDDLNILAEMFNPDIFIKLSQQVNFYEHENVTIEDVLEEVLICLLEFINDELDSYVKSNMNYTLTDLQSFMWFTFNCVFKHFIADNPNVLKGNRRVLQFNKQLELMAGNEQFKEIVNIPELINKKLELRKEKLIQEQKILFQKAGLAV